MIPDKWKFAAEDFIIMTTNDSLFSVYSPQNMADQSNAKLEKLFADAVRVTGPTPRAKKPLWSEDESSEDTHQALLICVEPLEKKECEHELPAMHSYIVTSNGSELVHIWPEDVASALGVREFKCEKCGKKLRAKWEVAGE